MTLRPKVEVLLFSAAILWQTASISQSISRITMVTGQCELKCLLQIVNSVRSFTLQIRERKLQNTQPSLQDILPQSFTPWILKTASWMPKVFLQFSSDTPIVKVVCGMQRVKNFKRMCIEGGILRRLLHQPRSSILMLLYHCRVKKALRCRIQQLDGTNGVGLRAQFLFLPKNERIHIDAQCPRARLLCHEITAVKTINFVEERALVVNGTWRSLDKCVSMSMIAGARVMFEHRLVGEVLHMEALQCGWRTCTIGILNNGSIDENQIYKTT